MKLRAYFVVNQYIAGIHAGIQGAHAMGEMFIKYLPRKNKAAAIMQDWLRDDKTIIVLEGGYQSRLIDLSILLEKTQNTYPFATFREEVDALNGAMTAVAVVLPEYMYNPERNEDGTVVNTLVSEEGNVLHRYTQHEKDVIDHIKSLRLKGA